MNIIVKPYGDSLCHCRPDTSWERENKDFYSPECVNEVLWTPVVFARISKAGKCIGNKFAGRYYDGVGCGMLMYCRADQPAASDSRTDSPAARQAVSTCVDHTSILPMPLYNPVVMDGRKSFTVMKNGAELAVMADRPDGEDSLGAAGGNWKNMLEEAICAASQLTSLRIGDFVTVELSQLQTLAQKDESKVIVKGTFCENEIFEFNIIF